MDNEGPEIAVSGQSHHEVNSVIKPKSSLASDPDRFEFNPPALLHQLSEYVEKLNHELFLSYRKARQDGERAKMEIAHLVERLENSEQKAEQLAKVKSLLENQIESLEGSLDEKQKQAAILDKHIREVTKEISETKLQLMQLEEKIEQHQRRQDEDQREIERLAADRSRIESRLEDRERALELERREKEGLDKQCRRLNNDLSEIQSKTVLLEDRLAATIQKHDEEIRKLNLRIVHQCEQELQSFQNRLEASLASEFWEYEKLAKARKSTETAERSMDCLKRIFERLKDMGVDLKKGAK